MSMKTTKQIVDEVIEQANGVHYFLDFLEKIGRYKYRSTIKLTDIEIAQEIKEGKEAVLKICVDACIMSDFLYQDENRYREYEKFKELIQQEYLKSCEFKNQANALEKGSGTTEKDG